MVEFKGINMLPNYLIVGAAKSGTTSLHYYLQQHSDVFMPRERKELRFFSSMQDNYKGVGDENINKSIIHSIDQYETYFKDATENQIIGECSPDYLFFYEKSIVNIKKYLGDPKIIIILREPAARAYSHYIMYVRDGRERLSFENALEMEEKRKNDRWEWGWQYREVGLYYEQVRGFINAFSNVNVYLFDELKNDSAAMMNDICIFLGIKPIFNSNNTKERHNVSGIPKNRYLYDLFTKENLVKSLFKPLFDNYLPKKLKNELVDRIKNKNLIKSTMNIETKNMLHEFYREDILNLERIIRKDLSGWLAEY